MDGSAAAVGWVRLWWRLWLKCCFKAWMRDKDTIKDGEIVLYVNRDSDFSVKTISFKDAYCVRLYEYFNDGNSLPMYTKIGIMASSLAFGGDCEFRMID